MEDLETQLKTLLTENWSLQPKPIFHRNMRRVEGGLQEVNIIIAEATDVETWDKEGMADCLNLINVRTRIPSTGTTNEDVEKAKTTKFEVRKEIFRILTNVDKGEITKPEGWEWAFPTKRTNGDNFDAPQPLMGEDISITIAYQIIIEEEEA